MQRHLIALMLIVQTRAAVAQTPIDSAVARFYALRSGRPAWVVADGLSSQAEILLEATRSTRDGLDPADYQLAGLSSLLQQRETAEDAWRLDSLLTRAFLLYARDVSRGRIEPAAVDTEWTGARGSIDFVGLLDRTANQGEAGRMLAELEPPQQGYEALRTALQRYREIARWGAWPTALPQRLALEGYDTSAGLRAAVREFQRLHGLRQDGIVGPATRAALDIPAAARVEQIALNLERWRWLPRELGPRYILVNSAAFTIQLIDHDTVAWQARAIVGRQDWPTPIVSSVVTALTFRPVWKVPRVIAARELLPLIQRDAGYLQRERMHVFSDSLGELRGIELDPMLIDWSAVTESTFIYQLVQDAGGTNPLGGVKLIFRNRFSVFIHDTPARGLFSELWRTFSHGCVRVQHAEALVGRLLPAWPADSIQNAMSKGKERSIRLPDPVAVHLVYRTAWVTDGGLVAFSADPYRWDEKLAQALSNRRMQVTMEGQQQ